jgi:hypothetical protein
MNHLTEDASNYLFFTRTKEAAFKVDFYKKCQNFLSQDAMAFRVLSPFIGITAGFITVAKQIVQIAEDIFLGIADILGALVGCKECKLSRGLTRLVIFTTANTIALPFSVLYGAYEFSSLSSNLFRPSPDRLRKLQAFEEQTFQTWKEHNLRFKNYWLSQNLAFN